MYACFFVIVWLEQHVFSDGTILGYATPRARESAAYIRIASICVQFVAHDAMPAQNSYFCVLIQEFSCILRTGVCVLTRACARKHITHTHTHTHTAKAHATHPSAHDEHACTCIAPP